MNELQKHRHNDTNTTSGQEAIQSEISADTEFIQQPVQYEPLSMVTFAGKSLSWFSDGQSHNVT